MTFPIVALAIPSLGAGYFGKEIFARYFTPGMLQVPLAAEMEHAAWVPFVAAGIAIVGIAIAWLFYARPYANVKRALDTENRSALYKVVYHKFYFDEGYYAIVRQFLFGGIAASAKWFDDYIVGGLVKLVCVICQKAGSLVRYLQSGYLTFYIGTLIVGVLLWRYLGNLPV